MRTTRKRRRSVIKTIQKKVDDVNLTEKSRIQKNLLGAIGPYKKNCAAFGNPSGPKTPNYVNICKLGLGKIKLDKSTQNWDEVTKGILAYDRAETNGAFLGQLNVIAASSFIGPHGLLWGYDIANNTGKSKPTSIINKVPIYDIDPLLKAGEALFGTNQQTTEYYGQTKDSTVGPRFYIMPGEIQPCAVKSAKKSGSGVIWSAIGIGIPINSLGSKVARLFYEDAGSYSSTENPTAKFIKDSKKKLEEKMKNIAAAMIENGKDQVIPIQYSKIFIGFKMMPVMKDEYAEAITLSPYVTLAQDAIPERTGNSGRVGLNPEKLISMTLKEWEDMKFPM